MKQDEIIVFDNVGDVLVRSWESTDKGFTYALTSTTPTLKILRTQEETEAISALVLAATKLLA